MLEPEDDVALELLGGACEWVLEREAPPQAVRPRLAATSRQALALIMSLARVLGLLDLATTVVPFNDLNWWDDAECQAYRRSGAGHHPEAGGSGFWPARRTGQGCQHDWLRTYRWCC